MLFSLALLLLLEGLATLSLLLLAGVTLLSLAVLLFTLSLLLFTLPVLLLSLLELLVVEARTS